MKRILLALAIIASITACTKPETPNIEPEPGTEDTTTKSYVGCMRSDYPDIAIPGISIDDLIVYDIKTVCTYSSPILAGSATTHIYSGVFTKDEIIYEALGCYDIFPILEMEVYDEPNNIYISIPAETFDKDKIIYYLQNGKVVEKTDNIKSVNIKEAEVVIDNETFKTDICKLDIEITKKYSNKVIRIVYYGESIHCTMYGGIK